MLFVNIDAVSGIIMQVYTLKMKHPAQNQQYLLHPAVDPMTWLGYWKQLEGN